MAEERGQTVALTPVGALLYAAHTAVAQRRAAEATKHKEVLARDPGGRFDERSRVLGTWSRYLALSGHSIAREAPELRVQLRRVETMLMPGLGVPDGIFAFIRQKTAEDHKAQASAIDLGAMAHLPDALPNGDEALLQAAVLLAAPADDPRRTPFEDDLRRLVDPTGVNAGVPLEQRSTAAEGLLDVTERVHEDAISIDLSDAAKRVRLTRRDLEGLVRAKLLSVETVKNRKHVRLGELRRALSLPSLFVHAESPRVDGEMTFPHGVVRFVRGAPPVPLESFCYGGYIEFTRHPPHRGSSLSSGPGREQRCEELGLDHERVSLWARAWTRERIGRPLALSSAWRVIEGAELLGQVRSGAAINVLLEPLR